MLETWPMVRAPVSYPTGTRSERRTGLENGNAGGDPPDVRGSLASVGKRATDAPAGPAGVVASACMEDGECSNTGSSVGGLHAPTGNPRGPVRADRVAERPVILRTPGNAGRGKGPQVRRDAERMNACGSGSAYNPALRAETSERVTCGSEGVGPEWFDAAGA